MWEHKILFRLDMKLIFVIFLLMGISVLVISSMTYDEGMSESFFSGFVKNQIEWFCLGWMIFLFFAGIDYRKFSQWAWPLYVVMIVVLLGLFFVSPIQSVHRWYRIPFVNIMIQPSEFAKLIVVLTLGSFLEKKEKNTENLFSFFQMIVIFLIPFVLILKQPDLGTALVLYPITLIMSYFGGIHKKAFFFFSFVGLCAFTIVVSIFSGAISHEKMKPFFTSVLKEYQYERLNPNTYHQKASQTAIAIGGLQGNGWHKGFFSSKKWLPAAHTDSVFAAFGEEFGFLGLAFLVFLYYALIYFGFQVVVVARDHLGRLLSSGISVYLAMHVIVNIAMMCGFLPITGVPLLLVSYGGSSVLTTMMALGILQSIYSRRFMF